MNPATNLFHLPRQTRTATWQLLMDCGMTPDMILGLLDASKDRVKSWVQDCPRSSKRIIKPEDAVRYAAATKLLREAVEKGVRIRDGYYEFYDPGFSFIFQHKLPLIQSEKLILDYDFYDCYEWAGQEDVPQTRFLRIPVENSFNKSFDDQEKLLLPDEEVASVRVVSMFLVINALATGQRLLQDCEVRCVNTELYNNRVCIGKFGSEGFDLSCCFRGTRCTRLGLAVQKILTS